MGTKQTNLKIMLKEFYSEGDAENVNKELLSRSEYDYEFQRVYKQLGGILQTYPVNPRATYDIVFNDLIIELDEQLHFNRYRGITLESPIYDQIKYFFTERYKDYCTLFEGKCLSASGKPKQWSYKSCEVQFGLAGPKQVLEGNGSPRWKQRAFYDYLKDAGCFLLGQKLIRLSIYDKIDTRHGIKQLGDILEHNRTQYAEDVYRYISKY